MKTIISNFNNIVNSTPDKIFCTYYTLNTIKNLSYKEIYDAAIIYRDWADTKPGIHLFAQQTSPVLISNFLGCLMTENCIPACVSPINIKEHKNIYNKKIQNLIEIIKPSVVVFDKNSLNREFPENFTKNKKDEKFIQFSSGSTGLQKGVEINYEKFFNHFESLNSVLQLKSEHLIYSWLPFNHDLGLFTSFLIPLIIGCELHFHNPYEWIMNPSVMFDVITSKKITHTWAPNFAFELLSERIEINNDWNLSSLEKFISCGEPCYAETFRKFYNKFKTINLKKEVLYSCLGMAENCFGVTFGKVNEDFEPLTEALPGVEVKLNNNEILIKSNFLLNRYFNSSELVLDENDFFPTGDLASIIDGKIKINGRKKDLIIVQGKNIFPNDVEQIVNQIPGVILGRCVALGKQINGTEQLLILVEVESFDKVDQINNNIYSKIIEELDISSEILQVPKGWLIKTSSGKIARKFNYEKYLQHKEYLKIFTNVALKLLRFRGKDVDFLSPSKNLITSGLFSSMDMFEYMILIEKEIKKNMTGATGIYGQDNNSILELVFFLEDKESNQI